MIVGKGMTIPLVVSRTIIGETGYGTNPVSSPACRPPINRGATGIHPKGAMYCREAWVVELLRLIQAEVQKLECGEHI
jgi:hypothetical protein